MENIKTGDILLFSSNSPTGFLLRTAISSIWNHVGIAVRYIRDENGRCKIVEGSEGILSVFETNACERYDAFVEKNIIGAGFSSIEHIMKKYNRVDVRVVNNDVIPGYFATRLTRFTKKYRGYRFPSDFKPFVSVWLGLELFPKNMSEDNMFCSELVAQYIIECLSENLFEEYNGNLSNILGKSLPSSSNMYTPAHFDISLSPLGKILREQITIYMSKADLLYIILPPLLLILIFILALSMYFRGK